MPEPTVWSNCYDDSHDGLIIPEAVSHPAKMARGLVVRIFDYLFERGYLRRGDVCVDPFGGIGSTGIEAAYRGVKCFSCELEPRFFRLTNGHDCPGSKGDPEDLCPDCVKNAADGWERGGGPAHRFKGNYDLHRAAWKSLGEAGPVIVCGDSRKLRENLAGVMAHAVIGSPPFVESLNSGESAADMKARWWQSSLGGDWGQSYGETSGQVGAMPSGTVDSVIGSPPFSDPGSQPVGDCPSTPIRSKRKKLGIDRQAGREYGSTEGQIGSMASGDIASVIVSSPPFMEASHGGGISAAMRGEGNYNVTTGIPGSCYQPSEQGTTDGNLADAEPETFWSAARDIVQECFAILKPGGVAAWVVKAFVRKGKIQDFPGDWLKLCLASGFVLVEEIHASLVKEDSAPSLFGGIDTKVTARKSFFRRIYEKKYPQNAIDYEVVLIVQKPSGELVVGSGSGREFATVRI